MNGWRFFFGVVLSTAFFCSVKAQQIPSDTVSITVDDRYVLVGELFTLSPEEGPAILAVHAYGGSRNDWRPLLPSLAKAGMTRVLAIDMRGHGDSIIRNSADSTIIDSVHLSEFGLEDYLDMVNDVVIAFGYLKASEAAEGVTHGIIGAYDGSDHAVKAAAQRKDVGFLALLSPTLIYRGVAINKAIQELPDIPVLIAASSGDEDYSEAAKWLFEHCSSPRKELQLYDPADAESTPGAKLGAPATIISNWLRNKVAR